MRVLIAVCQAMYGSGSESGSSVLHELRVAVSKVLALSDSLTAHLAADSQSLLKPSPQEKQRAVWGVCRGRLSSGAIEDPTQISGAAVRYLGTVVGAKARWKV